MRSAVAVVLAMTLSACPNEDEEREPPANAGAYIVTFANVFCGEAFRCREEFPDTGDFTFEEVFGANEAACKTRVLSREAVQGAVDAGDVTYNEAAAVECLDTIDALTCPDYWTAVTNPSQYPASCDAAIDGQVDGGGSCNVGGACDGEGDCIAGFCEGGVVPPMGGTIHITWTANGMPAGLGCTANETISFVSLGGPPGADLFTSPPLPCTDGQFTVDGLTPGTWNIQGALQRAGSGVLDMEAQDIVVSDQATVEATFNFVE
jgi:hypothetical protein